MTSSGRSSHPHPALSLKGRGNVALRSSSCRRRPGSRRCASAGSGVPTLGNPTTRGRHMPDGAGQASGTAPTPAAGMASSFAISPLTPTLGAEGHAYPSGSPCCGARERALLPPHLRGRVGVRVAAATPRPRAAGRRHAPPRIEGPGGPDLHPPLDLRATGAAMLPQNWGPGGRRPATLRFGAHDHGRPGAAMLPQNWGRGGADLPPSARRPRRRRLETRRARDARLVARHSSLVWLSQNKDGRSCAYRYTNGKYHFNGHSSPTRTTWCKAAGARHRVKAGGSAGADGALLSTTLTS